jgi:hypothetical protein
MFRNSTVPQQPAGAFWAIVNHGLVMFQLVVLFIAEIGLEWTTKKFNIYFPVLGDGFGLGPLGIFQALYVSLFIFDYFISSHLLM